MAPTRAHTYLPVAAEQANLTGGAALRNGSRNSRFTEIPPSVRHERDTPVSLRVSVHRVQPVAAAKADIREAEERTKRENPTREPDERTYRQMHGRTDGRTDGRSMQSRKKFRKRRNLITRVWVSDMTNILTHEEAVM